MLFGQTPVLFFTRRSRASSKLVPVDDSNPRRVVVGCWSLSGYGRSGLWKEPNPWHKAGVCGSGGNLYLTLKLVKHQKTAPNMGAVLRSKVEVLTRNHQWPVLV